MFKYLLDINAFCLFLDPFADDDDDRTQEANNNIRKSMIKRNLDPFFNNMQQICGFNNETVKRH